MSGVEGAGGGCCEGCEGGEAGAEVSVFCRVLVYWISGFLACVMVWLDEDCRCFFVAGTSQRAVGWIDDVLFSRSPSSSLFLHILPRSFLLWGFPVVLLLATAIALSATVPSTDIPKSTSYSLDRTKEFAKGGVL